MEADAVDEKSRGVVLSPAPLQPRGVTQPSLPSEPPRVVLPPRNLPSLLPTRALTNRGVPPVWLRPVRGVAPAGGVASPSMRFCCSSRPVPRVKGDTEAPGAGEPSRASPEMRDTIPRPGRPEALRDAVVRAVPFSESVSVKDAPSSEHSDNLSIKLPGPVASGGIAGEGDLLD